MLIIDSSADLERALASPIGADLKRVLALRRSQLDGEIDTAARLVIVEPRDPAIDVEAALGFSPTIDLDGVAVTEPCFEPWFEWAERHSGWIELVFVLSDEGPAQVLLLPDRNDIDPVLLALCRDHV